MKRLNQYPALALLFALVLLVGGYGAAQAQQAERTQTESRPDSTACPMMGEDGTMDMEGMDMQAMMEDCPMMQRMMEDGEGTSGMMRMMSMMKDCPMMKQMMERCPMMGGMMEGMMRSDSTMQHDGMRQHEGAMPGMMQGEASGSSASAVVEDGTQTVEITVGPSGFEPDAIRLEAGVPARLAFTRTTDRTCATEVQVPAFGVEKTPLPLNEEVLIAFTPEETGTFAFTCGMNMMRGTIVVEG